MKNDVSVKAQIMDDLAMHRSLVRMTHEIIEHNHGVEEVVLMGIKRRGVPLANIIAENIKKFEQVEVPVGYLDIRMHRDDLPSEDRSAIGSDCSFPVDIQNKTVIIVDDVLFTGRSVRAAMETVFSNGRPKMLQLAVLVDRGHRELPIRADYVGKNIPTARSEHILVKIEEIDGETGVYICE